ncbi:hypothetical protein ACFE33_13430 [Falsihalocynthiibacter sp. SS001]|uniref:capsular polysaccharide export protein, LipB/KpsS family n=1 Tax=Falsihalocynthiibacter sp. SS001 TaxID=3349698 RepID=UPI0036D3C43A
MTSDRLKVILEVPVHWFRNSLDGERHRVFYSSLLGALSRFEARVDLRDAPFGTDDAPRVAPADSFLFSFHSHGETRRVLRLKESYIPPYYTIDRMGYGGFSELAKHPQRFEENIANFDLRKGKQTVEKWRQEFLQNNISKYSQPSTSEQRLPERFLFFPLQTIDDPVASLAHIDQMEALEVAARHCVKVDLPLVVKRHPLCRSPHIEKSLQQLVKKYPGLEATDASVHQVLDKAYAVMGANSGVLFEALIHGKPVISFGTSDYRQLTSQVNHAAKIPAAIDTIKIADQDSVARFIGWYMNDYCVHAEDIDAVFARIKSLLQQEGSAHDWHKSEETLVLDHYSKLDKIRRREAVWGRSWVIRFLSRIIP